MERLQSWLKAKCNELNLSWREASIKAGLNPGAISAIMNDQRPGLETCKALAALFHVSPVLVLQLAGHIEEPISTNDASLTDPRLQYIIRMWPLQPDYAKDIFYERVKFMEVANPHVRANMRAAGIEPPPLPEGLSEKQRKFLEGE